MRLITLYKIRDGEALRAVGHFSVAEQQEMALDGWRNLRKEHRLKHVAKKREMQNK